MDPKSSRNTSVSAQRRTQLSHFGVNPISETVCKLTVYGWLKSAVHFAGLPSESSPVGEAETGRCEKIGTFLLNTLFVERRLIRAMFRHESV